MNKKNDCKDSSDKCDEFYKSGKCTKFKNLAGKICKKSCGYCNPSVKDLIDLKEKEKSIYHNLDPKLYSINSKANDRDKLLTFYDIYDNTSGSHNRHINEVKKNSLELDEMLATDEISLDKELLLKSKEESDWNDYLQIQAQNKIELDKITDKFKKNKVGYRLSLKLNRSWEKELEEVLLKMNNFKVPYDETDSGKSDKMKKKLNYFDIVNAVNIIKKRIDNENKIKKQLNTPIKKEVIIPTDNVNSFSFKERKKVKKYIKEKIKPNKKLNDYLNNVLDTINESKENFGNFNPEDEITIKEECLGSIIDKIPRFLRYVVVIILLLWAYGIVINQVKNN